MGAENAQTRGLARKNDVKYIKHKYMAKDKTTVYCTGHKSVTCKRHGLDLHANRPAGNLANFQTCKRHAHKMDRP